jgi:hypothetical protein
MSKKVKKYFGDWSDHKDMANEWSTGRYDYDAKGYSKIQVDGMATDAEVLVAIYEYEDYSGSAYMLFKRDGKIFEVEGGHCSCYGLEDQWEPAETTWKTLEMKDFYHKYADGGFEERLKALIAKHIKKPN